MVKSIKRLLTICISLCILFIIPVKAANGIEAFVSRLYKNCLNREPDRAGLDFWVKKLNSGMEVESVVEGFFFSKEMDNMQLSNNEFVEKCYKTLLDRKSDDSGKIYWLEKLKKTNKNMLLQEFMSSKEFKNLCNKYVINNRSNATSLNKTDSTVEGFIKRLYLNVLGREAENAGYKYWYNLLMEKRMTPTQVASEGFFHSKEFLNKQTNNYDFIDILYRTFLNREADKGGNNYWLNELSKKSRDEVIYEFSHSNEFKNIIKSSGWEEASNNRIKSQLTDLNSNLLIANKKYKLSSLYVPSGLREPNVNRAGGLLLKNEAASALENMFYAASREGIYLYAGSGYRSYSTQDAIYNNYVSRDGVYNADRYSARAGHSEHQTGLAIDIADASLRYFLSTSFGGTREGIWLKNNAHRFGFVLRYPSTKESITGYMYEPWHFRYVGIDYATAIFSEGSEMTLEEYFGFPGGSY